MFTPTNLQAFKPILIVPPTSLLSAILVATNSHSEHFTVVAQLAVHHGSSNGETAVTTIALSKILAIISQQGWQCDNKYCELLLACMHTKDVLQYHKSADSNSHIL